MPTRIIHVEVTEQDILDGEPQNDCECPVALALRRTLDPERKYDGNDLVSVQTHNVYFGPWINRDPCRLPSDAAHFIDAFDRGVHVVPFAFDIAMEAD